MSERLSSSHEHESGAVEHDAKLQEKVRKHHETEALKAKHEHKEHLEHIRETIEHKAKQSNEIKIEKGSEVKPDAGVPSFSSADLSSKALKQNLNKIQRHLSRPERGFSKAIHSPAVNAASEASSKTIGNANGLLFGAGFALMANLGVLIVCRYLGYEYNYLIGLVSFAAGFVFGLFVDIIHRRKARTTK